MTDAMLDTAPMERDAYWAATQDPYELVDELFRHVDTYAERLEEQGRLGLWRKATGTYFGLDPGGGWANSAAVKYGGESQENVLLRVNHFGNLVDHITSLTTSNRLAAKARALGTGPEAAAQVQLADALIENHLDGGLEAQSVIATRHALLCGEGFIAELWDADRGPAGEVHEKAFHPIDVIRDPYKSTDDLEWVILRHRRNRWDMIALYPEFYEELRSAAAYGAERNSHLWPFDLNVEQHRADEDEISVYEFFHCPCPALPQGRVTLFVESAPLRDGPNSYGKIPVNGMRPIPEMFSPFGFSRLWDLLGVAEALDSIISTFMTNADAFGVQGVWTEPGSNLDATELGRGLVHFTSPTPPQAVQLHEPPKQIMEFAEFLIRTHETLSGVNSVARGDVPSNVRSGNALAMVHQVAIQFNSSLQSAYARMMEACFTDVVKLYQKFGSEGHIAEMVGDDQMGYIREFKADDLSMIRRVAVDLGNPVLRTSAGRMDVANLWVERGLIQDPRQYLNFVVTGRLEELYSADRTDAILIKRENERLRTGQPVKALLTDKHQAHVREHAAELATPDVRENDAIAGVILAHIQEHINQATNMPPPLAILTGQQNLLQIMSMMMAGDPAMNPAAQGDAGAAGAEGGAEGGRPPGEQEPGGSTQSRATPEQPRMPTNPQTGEEYDPAAGV